MARTVIGMSPCAAVNEDDRDMNIGLGQFLLEIEPPDPWQPDVEDETTGRIRTLA